MIPWFNKIDEYFAQIRVVINSLIDQTRDQAIRDVRSIALNLNSVGVAA